MSTNKHEVVLRSFWRSTAVDFDLKAVLTAIAVHSGNDLTFVGTQQQLAKSTGLSYPRVSSAITILENDCAIAIRKQGRGQTSFEVTPHGFVYLLETKWQAHDVSPATLTPLDWEVLRSVWREVDLDPLARALVTVITVFKQPSGAMTTSDDEIYDILSHEHGPLVTQMRILRHYGVLTATGSPESMELRIDSTQAMEFTTARSR